MKKNIIIVWMFLISSAVCMQATGQDLHYADIQNMNIWYNQALKLERAADVRFNFRDIKYFSLLAFRASSGILNVPLVKKQYRDDYSGKSFLNATAAAAFDKSSKGIYKNNTGMVGLSYAQRLSEDQTYLSIGFQGSNTSTTLGTFGSIFPDQFDQFGPLPTPTRDPLRAGRRYNWMSLNAGVSLFQYTKYKEWYIGSSVRHINRPFTDEQKTIAYRLAPTWGFQAGLTTKNEFDQLGVYTIVNLKAQAHEYLVGARFSRVYDKPNEKSEGNAVGVGIALRMRDAVIPNINLKFNKTMLSFHYDINISGLKAAGYSRQGFEIAVSKKLN